MEMDYFFWYELIGTAIAVAAGGIAAMLMARFAFNDEYLGGWLALLASLGAGFAAFYFVWLMFVLILHWPVFLWILAIALVLGLGLLFGWRLSKRENENDER